MTPAQEHLASLKKRRPPRYRLIDGRDRAQQLFDLLAPSLPDLVQSLHTNGTIVIGEIGLNRPDARTIPVADNGSVIEITSGMMDFVYAVARALAGVFVGHSDSGQPENQPALDLSGVVEHIAALFQIWARHAR